MRSCEKTPRSRHRWLHSGPTRRGFCWGLGGAGLWGALGCQPGARGSTQRPAQAEAAAAPFAKQDPEGLLGFYTKLQGFCDAAPPVTVAEREERLRRFQAAMKAMDLDVYVAEAGTQLTYLTGLRWWPSERPFLVWFEREGPLNFLSPHFEANKLITKLKGLGAPIPTIDRWREHESAAAVLKQVWARRKLQGKKVAIDPWMRSFVAKPIEALAGEAHPGDPVVVQARARKTPTEVERLLWANKATKASIAMASANLEFGMRQSDLAAHLRAAQQAAGLSSVWVLSLFGPNASFPHGTPDDRVLQRGDVVLVDTGGSLHEYQSDVSRSFALAPVDPKIERATRAVHAAQQAAIDAVAVGRSCGSVDAAARQVMRERGYGGSDQWFTHRTGHGIGVQVHEAPYMVAHSDQTLDLGMSFSVEPGIYVPEAFGVRIEDIVVVEPQGAKVLGPRCTMDDFYLS